MPYPQLDRSKLKIKNLQERSSKVKIDIDHLTVDSPINDFQESDQTIISETVSRIVKARENDKPVIMAFGAHTIKNGLAPVLIKLIENGWVTHLATNGAGIIHDWEFAFQGRSSEDVEANVAQGQFGIWQETGFNINLAICVGAYMGLGYGESVGAMIENESLTIPSEEELTQATQSINNPELAAAAADLLYTKQQFQLNDGKLSIPHPFKKFSIQGAAYRLGIPFTGHPMFGHDIIYNHPMNHGAAIGRTAQLDFLAFAENVRQLENGVYLSVGSAVMSPMIFEKSLSMAQNLAMQNGKHIDNHFILVVDLAENTWDWTNGEPPMDNPAYYLRYCKTFSRMGGEMRYLSADNRDFLIMLTRKLIK